MKGRINIKNDAGQSRVTIDIEGMIGLPEEMQFEETGNRVSTYGTLRSLMERVPATGTREILVNIRSTGGSVGDALLIYDTLRESGADVTTRCYGYVASAATIIAQAASPGKREVSDTCLYLVHNSSCETEGNSMEMESAGEMLKKTDARIAGIYARSASRDAVDFVELMAQNGGRGRWLSPEEVLEYGLADTLITGNSPGWRERRLVKNLGLPALPGRSGLGRAVQSAADRIWEYLTGNVREARDTEVRELVNGGGREVRDTEVRELVNGGGREARDTEVRELVNGGGREDGTAGTGFGTAGVKPTEDLDAESDYIREAVAGYDSRERDKKRDRRLKEENDGGIRDGNGAGSEAGSGTDGGSGSGTMVGTGEVTDGEGAEEVGGTAVPRVGSDAMVGTERVTDGGGDEESCGEAGEMADIKERLKTNRSGKKAAGKGGNNFGNGAGSGARNGAGRIGSGAMVGTERVTAGEGAEESCGEAGEMAAIKERIKTNRSGKKAAGKGANNFGKGAGSGAGNGIGGGVGSEAMVGTGEVTDGVGNAELCGEAGEMAAIKERLKTNRSGKKAAGKGGNDFGKGAGSGAGNGIGGGVGSEAMVGTERVTDGGGDEESCGEAGETIRQKRKAGKAESVNVGETDKSGSRSISASESTVEKSASDMREADTGHGPSDSFIPVIRIDNGTDPGENIKHEAQDKGKADIAGGRVMKTVNKQKDEKKDRKLRSDGNGLPEEPQENESANPAEKPGKTGGDKADGSGVINSRIKGQKNIPGQYEVTGKKIGQEKQARETGPAAAEDMKPGKTADLSGKIHGAEKKRAGKKIISVGNKKSGEKTGAFTQTAGTVVGTGPDDPKNKADEEKEDKRKNILPSLTKPKEDPGMDGRKLSNNQQTYIEDLKRIKTV